MDSKHKKSITLIVISVVLGLTIFSVVGFSVIPAYEPQWTTYMHDESHTGTAVSSTIDSFNVQALRPFYKFGVYNFSEIYYSSNVIPGFSPGSSIATFGVANGSVMFVDTVTGSYLGSYSCGGSSFNTEALGAGALDDRGVFYIGCGINGTHAVNLTTFQNIWVGNISRFNSQNWTESSPAVVNGVVYTASYNTSVLAFNATNGLLIWSFKTGDLIPSSPAVVNGVVYINSLDNQTYALNATNGTKIWNTTTGCTVCSFGMLESSPLVVNGIVYIGSDNNQTYALNATNGSKIWNTTLNGPVGHSSPIYSNNIVYIGSKTGRIYALNATNGSQKWTFNTAGAVEFPGAYANGLVYFGSDDHNLYVLGATDGFLYKKFDLLFPVSAPVVAGDKVYARTYGFGGGDTQGSLHVFTPDYDWEMFGRFSGHSGTYPSPLMVQNYNNIWNFSVLSGVTRSSVAIASVPQVAGFTLVFIGGSDNRTYAINASNGKHLWNFTANGSVNSPAFATFAGGSMVIATSEDNQTYGLNATNGVKLWNFTATGPIRSSPIYGTFSSNVTKIIDGYIELKDVVYFGSEDKQVYAINPINGLKIWNFTLNGSVRSSPSLGKFNGANMIFVGAEDKQVYALNASSGNKIWNFTTGDVVRSSATDDGFYIFIGSSDRQIYALNMSNGAKIWNFTSNGSIESSPIYGNIFGTGMVFVGSNDNQTYALDQYSGAKIWNFTTGSNVTSSPVLLAIDQVAITSTDGKLYFLNASTGALIKNFVLGSPSTSSPAISRTIISGVLSDIVVVGAQDNKYYAFGSPTIQEGGSGGRGNYGCFGIVNQTMCQAQSGCKWKSDFNMCVINEDSLSCNDFCDACKNQTGCQASTKVGKCIWETSYNKCHENFTSYTYGSGGNKTTDYYVNFTPPICASDPTVCSSLFNSTRGYIKQEVCNNNVDDNGDGNIDCLDPMCFGRFECGTYNASLDNTSPQIIDSKLDTSNDSIMFSWYTDRPTNSSVKFFNTTINCAGIPVIYNESFIAGNQFTIFKNDHHIYLDSFKAVPGYPIIPNITYFYRLNGTSQSNRSFETACLNITTLFAANKTIPFAINSTGFNNFKMDFGSGFQQFNTNETLSLNATANFKMSIPFSGGSEIIFPNMSLLASKSLDFTNTFGEQNYSNFGGKKGFFMNSDKFAEMIQKLALKASDNITITIPSVGQRIYKCANESTGSNCIDVTANVTVLGNNGTHSNVSVPVWLGFSSYISAGTAALDIWNQNDTGKTYAGITKYAGEVVTFFANYTNVTTGINITGATCMFNLTGASATNMSYNDTIGLYFINKTVASAGATFYTVNCTASGHTSLNTTANVTLTNAPSGGSQVQLDSNGCGKLFCLTNAFNTSGSQTVKICTATNVTVRDFNIWYNGTGPFNLTGVNGFIITQANYTNSTGNAYDNNLGVNNATGGKCTNFVLNGTLAPFTAQPVQINVTAYNLTNYATAASQCASTPNGCNGTMFTINYISITARYPSGGLVSNALIMVLNNVTKSYDIAGPAMTDNTGYFAEHCLGVISGVNCTNTTGGTTNANLCANNGVPFPANNSPPSGSRTCDINSTKSFFVFDFITSNVSQLANITPNVSAEALASNLTVVGFIMPTLFSNSKGFSQYLNVSSTAVNESISGVLVYYSTPTSSQDGPKGGAPFFAQPNIRYTVTINVTGFGVYSYPYMSPVSGMAGIDLVIPNTSSTTFTTFVGKVVNESGIIVPNATVYAQYAMSGGGFGIQLINSSVTDANGRFTISVPRTVISGNNAFPVYQFYIVSGNTNNGVPIYFPTVDNNNGRGYFAQGSTIVLSPMTLKAGGRVDINVTLNGASLILSELSKIQILGTGDTRSAVTGKFNMISIFSGVSAPTVMTISLLSPISTSRVYYNAFGKNESLGAEPGTGSASKLLGTCTNAVSVSQGLITPSNCNLSSIGYLNLSAANYVDIFDQSGSYTNESIANFGFWFDTYVILKDSNRNVTLFLSPGGNILQDLLGYGGSGTSVKLPVPAGNYSIDVVKGFEYGRYLSVYNRSNISIVAGTTVNYTARRSSSWQIRPQFPSSLSLSANTTLLASVFSPNTNANGGRLNSTHVTLKGHLLYLDKTNATNPTKTVNFTYSTSSPGVPEGFRAIFNASSLGLPAGKYFMLLNATNISTDVGYETTMLMPVNVFDFSVGLDIGGFSFGAGQNISAKIFAFDSSVKPPIGVNATGNSNPFVSSNVSIAVYDPSGGMATYTYNASPLVNGEGSANITLPSTVGFYQIVSTVTATDGKQGVSENWIQVSTLNIKTTSDRQGYQPTDTVLLTVQILNASNNAPISSASVEAVVDNGNTPASALTGTDGKATIKLDPTTYSTSGSQWQFGFRNVKIRVSKDTGTDIIKLETYSGFDVRGFQSFVKTDKFSYSTTDNVIVQVFSPPGITPTDVKAIVDGNATGAVSGVALNNQQWTINLSQRTVGHHNVEVKVTANGGIQSFFTGFDVSSYVIKVSTNKFSYSLNENISLTVSLSYPNGSAVTNKNVSATLLKAQPPNDINVSYSTANTSSTGIANLILNASKGGFNYIRVDVDGQAQFIGLQVSSIAVSLLNGISGTSVTNYNTSPGSSMTIYVNATSTGSNVPDGSVVTATIWAFGNPITLPTNTTINGNTTIPVQIPSNAPAQVYGLDVKVTTPSGEQGFAPPATLTVRGGTSLQLSVNANKNFLNAYTQLENATFVLFLSYPNNTGVSGENVTIEVGTRGGKPTTVGTAVTDLAGSAILRYNISTNDTDGEYFIHAFITNNTDVQSYGGYLVSSLGVIANLSNVSVNIGGVTTVSVSLFNKTTGNSLNATSGFVSVFLPNKGEISQSINVSGTQPYTLNISVPNESSAVGTYPMRVEMFVNSSRGTRSLLLDVKNTSHSLNMTLPSSIVAGTSFLVNLTSTLNGTPTLVIFSPSANSVVYENKSIVLGGSNLNASLSVTINTQGVYIVKAFLNGIGSVRSVVTVTASSNVPIVWLQNNVGTNVTNYTTSQDVYVYTNIANATATILTFDSTTGITTSFEVPLNQVNGVNYYGILDKSNLVSGKTYFVRVDTSSATAVANTIFKVL